jgi:MipA family protein
MYYYRLVQSLKLMTTSLLQFSSSREVLASSLALLVCCGAIAQQRPEAPGAPPLWEVGGFALGVSQQAYPGSDQQVHRALALPYFIYRGEVFRADRETVGLRAFKTPDFELDIGFAAAFGSSANDIEARRGMELGPRLKWNLGAGPGNGRWQAEFPLRAVFDLDDKAAHRGLSFEPKLTFERQALSGWGYSASVSAIVADQKLASTFYEVAPAEATAQRAAYAAKSGLVAWRLSTSASRSLSPDWRVFGFVRLDSVAGAANGDSPLVRQQNGASVGVGVTYTWLRSEQRARD